MEASTPFPSTHPSRRPRAHRAATWALAAAWRRRLLPEPSLDPAELEDAARRRTGLHDFGAGWRPAFEALLTSLRSEARLNPLGRTMASGQIGKIL